jgi:hypothetical protein
MHQLFDCDVRPLLAELAAMPAEIWDVDGARQAAYRQHQHTRSIRFAWLPNSWQRDDPVEIEHPSYAPAGVQKAAWALGRRLEAHFGGRVVKLMLAELKAGGRIAAHVDLGDALTLVHRCHVPIITNDRVHMMIDGARYCFARGRAFEFDNTRWHGVLNDSGEARVHLICDVLEHGGGHAGQDRMQAALGA